MAQIYPCRLTHIWRLQINHIGRRDGALHTYQQDSNSTISGGGFEFLPERTAYDHEFSTLTSRSSIPSPLPETKLRISVRVTR
jgi:hypothetical protein